MQRVFTYLVVASLVLRARGDAEDLLVPGQNYPETDPVDKDALCACLAAWGALLGVMFLKVTRGWAIDMTPCIHRLQGRAPIWCLTGKRADAQILHSDDEDVNDSSDDGALSSEEMVILDIDYPLPLDTSTSHPQVADRRGESHGVLYDYFCLAPKDLHPSQLCTRLPNRRRLSTVMEEALDEPVLETRRLIKKLALFREPLPTPCSPLPAPRRTVSRTTTIVSSISSPREPPDIAIGQLPIELSSSDSEDENTFIRLPVEPKVDPLAGFGKWPAWLSEKQKPPETSRLWPLEALPVQRIGEQKISNPWFSQPEF